VGRKPIQGHNRFALHTFACPFVTECAG